MNETTQLLTPDEARSQLGFEVLYKQYSECMHVLHGDTFFIEREQLSAVLRSRTEMILFSINDGIVIGTAQASLIHTPPLFQVMFSNVAVREDRQKEGVGKNLITYLTMMVKAQWGKVRPLRVFLTNEPSKQNGAFYQKLDFTPRIDERVTIVWEKII